jgi:putative phosphoribosyl transferase
MAEKRDRFERVDENRFVQVQAGSVHLDGNLYFPENPAGLVVFVHGSGSSRHSPRNQYIAGEIQQAGMATLLFDLLTPEEEEIDLRTRHLRFDINLLARRTIETADWLNQQHFLRNLKIGFFGASTGAAAALIAAAERPEITGAIVSRGGRPDLAANALPKVEAATLLIVGQMDYPVLELNQQSLAQMSPERISEMAVVPGASHLFEEPGALEHVAQLATNWFRQHLSSGKILST